MPRSIKDRLYYTPGLYTRSVHPVCIWQQCTVEAPRLPGKGWSSHVHTESLKCLYCLQAAWSRDTAPVTGRKQLNHCLFLSEKDRHWATVCGVWCACVYELGLGWSPKPSKVCRYPHSLSGTKSERFSEVGFNGKSPWLEGVLDPVFHL